MFKYRVNVLGAILQFVIRTTNANRRFKNLWNGDENPFHTYYILQINCTPTFIRFT